MPAMSSFHHDDLSGETAFVGDPDYTLNWPASVFAEEAGRLVRRAAAWGITDDWVEEVGLLLRQAFQSSVPADDFTQVLEATRPPTIHALDEEPF
jgi:hypothetical protein